MKKIVFFIFITAFTLITGLFVERYVDCSPELLLNADFHDGLAGWTVQGESNSIQVNEQQVVITGGGAGVRTALSQVIEQPARFGMLRLSGDLAGDNIKQGRKVWNLGRLLLMSHDANGKWIPINHEAGKVLGTSPWQSYRQVFILSSETHVLQAVLQLNHTTGVLHGTNLSLKEVEEVWWYPWLRYGCFGLWAAFLLIFLFPPYLQDNDLIRGAGLTLSLFMVLIILGTTIPGSLKMKYNSGIDQQIHRVESVLSANIISGKVFKAGVVQRIRRKMPNKSKVAHVVLFFGLAVGLGSFSRNHVLFRSGVDIVMLATCSELLQFYVEGRSPFLGDFGLDLGAAAMGFFVVWLVAMLWRRSKKSELLSCL